MSFETIAIVTDAGLLGGWLAGSVMKGGGYGLVGDIMLGVIGGFVGGFTLWRQGLALGGSAYAMVGAAFVGAFILVVAQRKFWNVEIAAAR
jgi:uncharacterized membrane protein YeaQ/YmgE (transglycosylase-associated protein family)